MPRRPFWFSAANYYILIFGLAAVFFFVAWGILRDYGEEAPWISSGIGSAIFLIGAVIFREVLVRREARRRASMGDQVFVGTNQGRRNQARDGDKLTIERNQAVLAAIKQRSDAARILDKVSAGHLEVVDLAREYLVRNEDELKRVAAGSPRLAPLLRGRTSATEMHRYHLLRWAEIEATGYTIEASSQITAEQKLLAANRAMQVVNAALDAYPEERSLADSRSVIGEMIVSIRVSALVNAAKDAESEGDLGTARRFYRDALIELGQDNVASPERSAAAERINFDLNRIRANEGSV